MAQHILFIVNNFPPHVGGVETHVFNLSRMMVAHGHKATVIALADAAGESVEEGVTVIRLKRRFPIASVISFPDLSARRRIVRRLRGVPITAVSTHTRFFPMSALGGSIARRLGVPWIHTEHGSGFVRGVSPLIALASRFVDLTLGRNVLRRSDMVLAVSENVAAFVRQLAGVDAQVFYNAVDLDGWPAPVPSTGAHFVFVGRLVPGKGWDTLLDAASILRSSRADLDFTVDILGDGPEMGSVLRHVRRLGLEETVRVHGHVPPANLPALLSNAVLVNPTVLAEGFQTSLLEALAGGSQIVSYPVPGLSRLLEDGAPIRVVTEPTARFLANAMAEALDSPQPPYPTARLEQWAWPARAGQYAEIVSQLERARKRPARVS